MVVFVVIVVVVAVVVVIVVVVVVIVLTVLEIVHIQFSTCKCSMVIMIQLGFFLLVSAPSRILMHLKKV